LSLDFNSFEYTSSVHEASAIAAGTDELMVANMIAVLNNPAICNTLNEDELRYLVIAVKNHVVNSAKKVVNDQL
jgi:hypothetical protein